MSTKKNTTFFKVAFSIGVILLLGFTAGGLAKLLAFFNTGSDRATMLNLVPDISNEYTPKVNWLPDEGETGRKMESFNRQIVARDYVRALYQRNLALLTADTSGIMEYYTIDARPKVYSLVNSINKRERAIERAELNHNLKLHFYSADGQLVSFTDYNVESRQRIIDISNKNERVFSNVDIANFEVLMQLVDGYWRIKHLIRNKGELGKYRQKLMNEAISDAKLQRINKIRGINYYPQKTPWKDFWIKYDEEVIEKDLQKIKKLRLNTVRVFVNYEQFGKGNVVPEMLERLEHFLDNASKSGIGVLVTLFDFNSNYQLLNFPATDRQLETILTRFKSHPAVIAWDLKNEPDLDFHYQNEADVKEWLNLMVRQAKIYDPTTPITIGWAYPESADHLAEKLDFISFHYYREVDQLGGVIDSLKKQLGAKPLLLEEFGLSSYESSVLPISITPYEQAKHLSEIQRILFDRGNVPYIYWTLYDFENVGANIAGNRPWQRNAQKHFGLIDTYNQPKPVAGVISRRTIPTDPGILDKIPLYLINYALIGVIFAAAFVYLPFFRKLFRKHKN
ncbi:MAG: hypothetical protein ACI9V1_000603 [Spirosomataceae bacterium]|jgi:hypothetical protein